jgi:hypothetical protein
LNAFRKIISFCLLVAILCFSKQSIADSNKNTLHIIGDSQACGVGSVSKRLNDVNLWSKIKISCKVGSRTSYWFDKISVKHGDHVIIFLGSNDNENVDAKPLLASLKNTRCVFVGPPLIRNNVGAADTLKQQVESDGTCRYLDSRFLHLKQIDGVHTNELTRWLNAALRLLILN